MVEDQRRRRDSRAERHPDASAQARSAREVARTAPDPDVKAGLAGGVAPFDGYDMMDVPLGDLMRGERATLGKSLLDVERELRIRATYIAAIENGDVGAFQSPGFIAGYVRSYARYLGIDPEWTFRRFCAETGFQGAHGFSSQAAAGPQRRTFAEVPRRLDPNEVLLRAPIGMAPERRTLFDRIEPGALGSFAVLVLLALGLGYGAWAVLHDIQRLQIAPVDEAPAVPMAQLDPIEGVTEGAFDFDQGFDDAAPQAEALGRLYRPEPLEVPVVTPRDGALAALDPDQTGTLSGLRPGQPGLPSLGAETAPEAGTPVQVTEARRDEVLLFAVNATWIRVTSASGTTLFEGTLNAGDSYVLPETEGTPRLRSGNSGSLYFAVNGVTLGPAGVGASIVREVPLSADDLTATYAMADASADPDLARVAELVLAGN